MISLNDINSSNLKQTDKQIYTNNSAFNFINYFHDISSILINLDDDNRYYVKISILGLQFAGLLDTGSQVSLIGTRFGNLQEYLTVQPLQHEIKLSTASGEQMGIVGYVDVPFTLNVTTKILPCLLVPELTDRCLLGMDFFRLFNFKICSDSSNNVCPSDTCIDLNICSIDSANDIFKSFSSNNNTDEGDTHKLTSGQSEMLNNIIQKFKCSEENTLDTCNVMEHEIVLTDYNPIHLNPHPWSPTIQKKINIEINRLLKLNIIEPSNSDWALQVVPVTKESGDMRLCLDARKINSRTIRDAYPLANSMRILSNLGKNRYFSVIDLKDAFLQVKLKDNSKKFTSFKIIGRGLFQYTRLPFGLINSSASLSRILDKVLKEGKYEPYVFSYLDDIIVATTTFEEHIKYLEIVAICLREANLSVNIKKCKFCLKKIKYLGFILSEQGYQPNPERVIAISKVARPQTPKEIRRFLGMAGYYRNFIPNFSGISAPISDLLKNKPKKIVWTEAAEKAFISLKEKLMSEPVLANPDWNKEFTVQTDASDVAIAGILTQQFDDGEHIIAYYSRKLTACEKKYGPTDKEGLAVLESIEHFRSYIEGSHFTLVTDCSAITFIKNSKWRPSSRLSRWSIKLQELDMTPKHRKGKDNIVCDTLSRSVCAIFNDSTSGWFNELKEKVKNSPDQYPNFKMANNVLFKFVSTRSDYEDGRFEWKIVVPPDQMNQLVIDEHNKIMHLGFEKTLQRIKMKYYWPKMNIDVRKILNKCATCKESKYPTIATIPPMGQQKKACRPFQMIAIDYLSGFIRSKKGYSDLLVCLDVFTKFVRLFPVKKINADITAQILRDEWFLKYGTPQIVISDNAVTFTSIAIKDLFNQFKVHHFLNSRRHCQNNPVERVNRVILACIRTYCKADHRLWDSKLAEIEFSINNTKHSSTSFTPFYLVHGFEAFAEGEDHQIVGQDSAPSEADFAQKRARLIGPLYQEVINYNQKQFEKYKKTYDAKHKKIPEIFKIDQKVYKKNFKLSNAADNYAAKLGPVYIPCKIIAQHGNSTYELEDEEGRNIGLFAAQDLIPA